MTTTPPLPPSEPVIGTTDDGRGPDTAPAPGIRALVSAAKTDAARLAKAQVELAQAEAAAAGKAATITTGLLVAAGVVAFLMYVFVLLSLAWLLTLWLPIWAGFLIVAGALLLKAVLLVLIASRKAKGIKGLRRSKVQLERTKAALRGSRPA